MNYKQLIKKFPAWKDSLTEDQFEDDIEMGKLQALTVGAETLYPFSGMWVDSGCDSSAAVYAADNLTVVFHQEIDHASNLSTHTWVYQKIDPAKKGYLLVNGDNGGSCMSLYSC